MNVRISYNVVVECTYLSYINTLESALLLQKTSSWIYTIFFLWSHECVDIKCVHIEQYTSYIILTIIKLFVDTLSRNIQYFQRLGLELTFFKFIYVFNKHTSVPLYMLKSECCKVKLIVYMNKFIIKTNNIVLSLSPQYWKKYTHFFYNTILCNVSVNNKHRSFSFSA